MPTNAAKKTTRKTNNARAKPIERPPKKITKELKIPTIGIGSSVNCDGQVLVTDDLIGLNLTSIRFIKNFYNIRKHIELAVKKFTKEVKSKKYPSSKFSY